MIELQSISLLIILLNKTNVALYKYSASVRFKQYNKELIMIISQNSIFYSRCAILVTDTFINVNNKISHFIKYVY